MSTPLSEEVLTTGVRADRPGSIETRGIEPVPDSERGGGALGLFWTWFAANIGVIGITEGAALVTFKGLNAWQALVAALVGSAISFLLVGLLSITGKRGGAPGLTLSRAVFGTHGNVGPTIVSWLTFVGWETITCTTAAYALVDLLGRAGLRSGDTLIVITLLVTVVIAASVGLFGHATIMWVQRWLTWIFGTLTLVVIGFLIDKVHWHQVAHQHPGSAAALIGAIGFIAAGTGIGWLSAGADYARYLPRRVRGSALVSATTIGSVLPLTVIVTMGALLAVSDPSLASANDPVAAIGGPLPGWLSVPYLIVAVIGLIANADLSMYSSGLNLITAGIRIRRTAAVAVDAVLIVAGGLYITVIAKNFYGTFTTFLTLLAIPMTAWAATIGIDMIRRREFDREALLDRRRGSRYWYTGGIRWVALLPWLLGIAIGLLFTTASNGQDVWFSGPWAGTWLGVNGLGWLASGAVSAALYAVLGLRSAAGGLSVDGLSAGAGTSGAGTSGGPVLAPASAPAGASTPAGGPLPAGGPVPNAGTDR
ncbi:purine-cytosine permease family protein [Rugosimonospora africana]|uniref:Allantoin permease n=1 Tax=Rugosimonospora africana TaxID=556532 RepID=A0A8J3VUN5_9ACTN|nr:cytosine permease [Rugosimonospora africana]GIH18838.1 allantoin permease [Rugosimonospora africana]